MLRIHQGFKIGVIAACFLAVPLGASAQVIVSGGAAFNLGNVGVALNFGPPAIPYYAQPPCPQPNYVWMPGYWAWGPAGYYWVPGTWVAAAQPGYYWTPGYWGYNGGNYAWNAGYWGPQVGFYGGINYGYGYYGNGYAGGRWQGNNFEYNTAVSNVNRAYVRNVYTNRGVYNNNFSNSAHRVSYNGGPGGVYARPTQTQVAYARGPHTGFTSQQSAHIQTAAGDRNLYSSVNRGRPNNVAVAQPYTSARRPTGYAPVTTQEQHAAQVHVVNRGGSAPAHAYTAPHTQNVQHAAAPQQHAAPVQHAAAPQQHAAAPQQHAAVPQQHAAAPQQRAAPQQHAAAPQQHAAAPQHYAAPQQHAAAPQQHAAAPQQHAPPQQHAAAPQQHAPPPQQHAAPPPQHQGEPQKQP